MQRILALAMGATLLGAGTLTVASAPAIAASPAVAAHRVTGRTPAPRILQHVDRVNVPGCVEFKTNFSGAVDHLHVINTCRKAKHVKVILDSARDFECRKISPGHSWHYQWAWPAKVNKVKGC